MDHGLYNKSANLTQRGSHGTLIGNWVEERSLVQATGINRHQPLPEQKIHDPDSFDRTGGHRLTARERRQLTAADSIPPSELTPVSTSRLHFPAHSNDNFTPKLFNQIGSNWHSIHSQSNSSRSPNVSQIILGSDKSVVWETSNHAQFPEPIGNSKGEIKNELFPSATAAKTISGGGNGIKQVQTQYNV